MSGPTAAGKLAPERTGIITENELFHVERITRRIIPGEFINSIKIQPRGAARRGARHVLREPPRCSVDVARADTEVDAERL